MPKKTKKLVSKTPRYVFVKKSKGMGRGVFANMDYKKGDTIFGSHLLRLSPGDQEFISKTTLQYYVYDSPNAYSGDCFLALGLGSLVNNNSYSANTGYEIDPEDLMIWFQAERDIKAGEQLFVNYGWE